MKPYLDYIWKHKFHFIALGIIYIFIFMIFFWSLDTRVPVSNVYHQLSTTQIVQSQSFIETMKFDKNKFCQGEIHRKFVSVGKDSVSIYNFDETPFPYPKELESFKTVTFSEKITVPHDIKPGKWFYEVDIEFRCNPIKATIYNMNPILVDIVER